MSTGATSPCASSSSTRQRSRIPIIHPNASARKRPRTSRGYSLGGDLYLETDVSDRDRFGRLLRYVWLDFGDGEVYLVNEALVRAGYAAFSTFPPDVKYVEEMREAGQFARENGYGLWSGCITDDEGDTNELSGTQGINAGQQTDRSCPDEARAASRARGHRRSGIGVWL